ncbi:hypothetical protein [Streptomyces sp. MP131-18]|uniref:hypothetical protein n=1 Tax=Streptomyces sp. MP131-18 TaxID=1857892 RepID=UPI0009D60B2E|nr:hypothetical protein [Streptomyces sp. MP131-18]ONK14366.1 putative NADH-flavin reductase [Streptomyces sp. MP131-18]
MLSFTNRFAPVESISGTTVVIQQPSWDNNTYRYDTIQSSFREPTFWLLNSRSFLERLGRYRLGDDVAVQPEDGGAVSAAQYALGFVDLIEKGDHRRAQVNLGH